MVCLSLFLIGVLKNVINLFSVLLESQWKDYFFRAKSLSTFNAVMKNVIRLSLKSSPVTKIIVYFQKNYISVRDCQEDFKIVIF